MKALLMTLIICALFLSVGVVTAQQSEEEICDFANGTLFSNGRCQLIGGMKISIEYPIDLAQNRLIASTVDTFIAETKNDFMKVIQSEDILDATYGPDYLEITYEEVDHSKSVVSLVFNIFQYYGGMHGITSFQTFTFDLKANKVLTFNDLFLPNRNFLAALAPYVEEDLEQLGMYHNWADPYSLDTYQAFALSQDELIVYFGDYDITAYAGGDATVHFSLSLLRNVLKPEFTS